MHEHPYDAPHAAALKAGQKMYRDPATGLWVMTSRALSERGFCCGNGCRHCPWPEATQKAAGRRTTRA